MLCACGDKTPTQALGPATTSPTVTSWLIVTALSCAGCTRHPAFCPTVNQTYLNNPINMGYRLTVSCSPDGCRVIHRCLRERRMGRVKRVLVFVDEGPQAQAWSGEMKVKILTLSCHLPPCLRVGWELTSASCLFPASPSAVPPGLPRGKEVTSWAHIPTKHHSCRHTDPQGYAGLPAAWGSYVVHAPIGWSSLAASWFSVLLPTTHRNIKYSAPHRSKRKLKTSNCPFRSPTKE